MSADIATCDSSVRLDAAPRAAPATVWIVMAAYNEESRLGHTLAQLLPRYANVVVVDDGSRDATAEVALAQDVWVLRHLINLGQGAALQTGIDFALRQGAQFIVTFDADGQHDAAEIDRLLEPLRAGAADVALGSRFLGATVHMPWTRRLVLKLGVLFTRVFSRIRVTDAHNGFRAFTRDAARKVRISQNRMAHASEILDQIVHHGLRYVEVPVTIRYSQDTLAKGQSSWNALRIVSQLLLGRMVK
ncbi:MAG: glycosyltransferase family 2 protein [Gemmataceae bacterium]